MQNKHEINVTFNSRRTHLPHAVTVAIKARAANDPSVLTITEKVLTRAFFGLKTSNGTYKSKILWMGGLNFRLL